ncbi:MAG: hypothetical protein BGO67_09260 [Alphaproteobacteria bacterium 41-28]|nr:MAG: hypothetical protein BGO67_09260 [Alphaproteobacteria bacterium 41-28]
MTVTKERKGKNTSKNLQMKEKEQTFEERKRAAYSAMGKLGGLARAKQMAEKGFSKADEFKVPSKKDLKPKGKKK